MKPAAFAYVRPGSVDEVLAELAGGDAKVLAGGQSLVPVLAMRLGRPATLVDIGAVPELDVLVLDGGVLRIGAAVRQRTVERSAVAGVVPLLGMALPFVGHRELRSRGTVCGSLAHADPAAELPAVAACLDAMLEIAGPRGRRRVPAAEFFAGAMTTAVGADEVLVAVELPVAAPGEGFGFAEIARRHGDFALAGAVARVRCDPDGVVTDARLVGFGVSDRPVSHDVTALLAPAPDEHTLRATLTDLVDHMVDTAGDVHASTPYRRRLLRVLAARELTAALRRARAADRTLAPFRGSRPAANSSSAPTCERRAARARVEVGEVVEVAFRVNGVGVEVGVVARAHLGDVLRDRLGLTGTHLGCEHGVCGMCTVLVDGAAVRACLLFAAQCDGAEVVTVEGLGGAAQEQHPLQQAFSAHHALQCGFCTPGMLMSAYDLLRDDPAPADLATQMSGVLCRCTGYRGILAAVADVAAAYPDGVPAPLGGSQHLLLGRGSTATATAGAAAEVAVRDIPAEIRLPASAPSATVDVTSTLAAPVDAVWRVLDDPHRLVACLPGAELLEVLDGDRYRGRAGVALGPVKLSFDGVAQIVERDAAAHRLRLVGQGADRGGSATQADIRLHARSAPDGGTTLHAEAGLYLSGRIAQFGRALAGDVSTRMFEQFAAAVDETARTGATPVANRAPSPVRLALGALFAPLRRRLAAAAASVRRRDR